MATGRVNKHDHAISDARYNLESLVRRRLTNNNYHLKSLIMSNAEEDRDSGNQHSIRHSSATTGNYIYHTVPPFAFRSEITRETRWSVLMSIVVTIPPCPRTINNHNNNNNNNKGK
jgi:hypothetical protein